MSGDPFEQIFGGAFAEAMRQAGNAQYGAAQQAADMANANAYAGQFNESNAGVPLSQPEGRRVTPGMRDEMLIRRTGNICREASGAGWQVGAAMAGRNYCFIFRRDGRQVTGLPAASRGQALVNAAEVFGKNVLGV